MTHTETLTDDNTTLLTIKASITQHANCAGYARLADVREDLDTNLDLTRAQQDRILKDLSKTRRAYIAPDSDRKGLTDRDHAAAVRIGGQENHFIALWEW